VSEPPKSFDRWLHDVRNQLSIILGFSEILLQELDAEDAKRSDIQEIHAAAERAMTAINHAPRRQEDGAR
jgi:signal transduction histidine kinase